MVLGSVIISSFSNCPVFPAPFIEKAVFDLLYILAFFVKNKVPIGAWVYFWAFCLIPLIYMSVLCQYHTVLVTVALYYNLKLGRLIPPVPTILLSQDFLSLLCFHMNCEIFFPSSLKNAIGNLIEITLNL